MIRCALARWFFFFFVGVNLSLSAGWEENLKNLVTMGKTPKWMKEQIQVDFDRCDPHSFCIGNIREYSNLQFWSGDPFLVHVAIVSGKVKLIPLGQAKNSDRLPPVQNALEYLCSIFSLPNAEFIISLHDSLDWYFSSANTRLPFPVFVFARHRESYQQILMPDWEIFRGYYPLLEEVVRASSAFPWEKRIEKGIWRGATTGALYTKENYQAQWRTQLVEQSFAYPSAIDARFNSICQNHHELEEEMKRCLGNSMSIYEQLQYKYQILIDGNTSAFSRAYWQLFSNSVIFKQESSHIQWYYAALRPYCHYIPFAHDSSNLAEKIEYAKKNDRLMKKIAANATNFARNNLKTEDVYLYLYLVIIEFAKRQNEADMYLQSNPEGISFLDDGL